jgi:hypothetical protein
MHISAESAGGGIPAVMAVGLRGLDPAITQSLVQAGTCFDWQLPDGCGQMPFEARG